MLSGEQWLEQVFRPRVAGVARFLVRADSHTAGWTRQQGAVLMAQVSALVATGVLSDEQARSAFDLIDEAGIAPEIRSVSASGSASGSFAVPVRKGLPAGVPVTAPSAPPELLRVSPGPRPLGRLDGRPVTLVSAELWSDRFAIDFFTETSTGNRRILMHRPSRLQALRWELWDEIATAYGTAGGSGEWGEHLDRKRVSWQPAPPKDVEQVTLLAFDGGDEVFSALIPVPGPARPSPDGLGEGGEDRTHGRGRRFRTRSRWEVRRHRVTRRSDA